MWGLASWNDEKLKQWRSNATRRSMMTYGLSEWTSCMSTRGSAQHLHPHRHLVDNQSARELWS